MVLCKRSPLFLRGVNAKRPNTDKRDMHINETLFPSAKMIKYMANYFFKTTVQWFQYIYRQLINENNIMRFEKSFRPTTLAQRNDNKGNGFLQSVFKKATIMSDDILT